ncbi:hypothetical protein [Kitasatospora camelliae]|uniref:Uncharacterized protein n=1 Tax=Kitasatospora camelliae TaxID=3156397 RepID=A0AAU8JZ27_9ACTN
MSFYVTRMTDVIGDRWTVEYEGRGPDGFLIWVSRGFDAPAGRLEVGSSRELAPELRAAVIADAREWLADFVSEDEERLLAERERIAGRPDEEDWAPPGLSRFELRVDGPAEEYAARLRTVLAAAVDRAVAGAGIDPAVVPGPLPAWFAAACANDGSGVPGFARRGAERFRAAGHGVGWSAEGWLERFEIDCPFRTWSWWDLTGGDDRTTLSLWVDAAGEDFFACDELRWAAYTAGAQAVTGPALDRLDGWRGEPSV